MSDHRYNPVTLSGECVECRTICDENPTFVFIGIQKGLDTEIRLYNLLVDVEGHPAGSTVSDVTLKDLGLL